MRRLASESIAKWSLFAILMVLALLPVHDLIFGGDLRTWSPFFYLDFLALSINLSFDYFNLFAALLALLGWGLLCTERKAGQVLLSWCFLPALVIYLILFLYVSLTIFFRNRHNTFFLEWLKNTLKFIVPMAGLFLQHRWKGKYFSLR